ncbi:hypothetical protein GGX14DRAFT_609363 [Mycena pura]|uniref:Conidiation-specific protein 13 n=1 Tax=Mycena pura TaxID=153505 RepID=A0AAD6UPF5_9AGAR|nr:hypothetical protein GGX14DRAFT_609363 [Mycena pura]
MPRRHALLALVQCLYHISWVTATLLFSNLSAAPTPPLSPLALRPQASGFDFDLYSALPPASSTVSSNFTDLPDDCAQYIGPGKECTAGMYAAGVTFEDCGAPFTVCRCADATMSMDTVLDRLGRVPVGLRRFVGTVLILNSTVPHAYTMSNGDIHLFGDCAMDTWVHEATHSYDFATSSPHSSSAAWGQAILADTCVPDNYSLTNQVEDFAQMSVIKTYTLLYDGHLPPGFRADCMAQQLDFMDTLPLYAADALFGNTCAIGDGQLGVRHDTPPTTLDPARAFATVSVDWSASPAAALDLNPVPTSTPADSGARSGRQAPLLLPFAALLGLAFRAAYI